MRYSVATGRRSGRPMMISVGCSGSRPRSDYHPYFHRGEHVNIHEYQAKDILRGYGVPIPPGDVASTAEEAEQIARRIGRTVVVKAQVHAGGRGKAGGVKLAKTPEEAREVAGRILGMQIKGLTVQKVLVTDAADIASEAYVGVILDRASKKPVFMVSPAGGIDIEEVAANTPEKIMRLPIDTRYGLMPFQAMELGFFLYPDAAKARAAAKIMKQLYDAFMANGASLAEINPLVVTPNGEVVALDAKMSIDDNELFRHPDIEKLRDETEENPAELRAAKAGLSYISLTGNIGCLVNGAGLAMSTMDIIKYHGGDPANFLDVGGGANKDQVTEALRILLSDSRVKAVLINIFGGIMKCDTIASAVVAAFKEVQPKVPFVVRLEGTNVEQGRQILKESGLNLIAATDLTDAAKKVVAAAKGA